MVNYQDGKIYKIVCNTTGLTYYGSTCELNLSNRLSHHRGNYKEYLLGKNNYITSFKVLENDNYEIVLVEKFPCNDKMELHQQERLYIENNECVNKIIPQRTPKEWREENQDSIKLEKQNYYINNKERLLKKQYDYSKINKDKISARNKKSYVCECGREIRCCFKTKHLISTIHKKLINKIPTDTI